MFRSLPTTPQPAAHDRLSLLFPDIPSRLFSFFPFLRDPFSCAGSSAASLFPPPLHYVPPFSRIAKSVLPFLPPVSFSSYKCWQVSGLGGELFFVGTASACPRLLASFSLVFPFYPFDVSAPPSLFLAPLLMVSRMVRACCGSFSS